MKILPKIYKKFRQDSIFNKLLLFFVLLISFSVIAVGVFSYINSSNLLIKEAQATNKIFLQQASENVEDKLNFLEKLTLQIAGENIINKGSFITKNYTVEDIILLRNIIKYLTNVKLTNEIIDSIFIYYNNSDLIIDSEGQYFTDNFFNNIMLYKNKTLTYWDKTFNNDKTFQVLGKFDVNYNKLNKIRKKYITIIRNYKLSERDKISIVINVKENEFVKIFHKVDIATLSSFLIVNKEGQPIISDVKIEPLQKYHNNLLEIFPEIQSHFNKEYFIIKKNYNKRNYNIIGFTPSNYGWNYLTVLPTYLITSRTSIIKKFTLIIVIITLISGLFISYLLTQNIYKPINNIINFIDIIKNNKVNRLDKKNELVYINSVIDEIYKSNNKLQNSLKKSLPMVKRKFLEDLVYGKYSPETIKNHLNTLQLEMTYNSFQIVIFQKTYLDNNSGYNLIKKFERINNIQNLTGINILFTEINNSQVVSLINIDVDDTDKITSFIESIRKKFNDKEIIFTVGVGNNYQKIEKVSLSYKEALLALQYKVIKGEGEIIHINEIDQMSTQIYDYPIETEQQIVNLVKSGDNSSVKELISSVIHDNISHKEISPEMIENLFNALAGTAIRTIYEINSSLEEIFEKEYNIYVELTKRAVLEDKINYIISVFIQIIDFHQKNKNDYYEKIYKKIKNYIGLNYQEDISLSEIANEIGYSPSYISIIFKDYSGTYFVDYLKLFRVKKAKEMFSKKSISVKKVARSVGFNSSQHFIRVFKEIEGITPGRYKKIAD